jgi:hypothetical protein
VLSSSSVVVIGLFSNVFQAPDFLRKAFMVAINIQIYQFVFAEALLLVVLGYWIYFRDDEAIGSDVSA